MSYQQPKNYQKIEKKWQKLWDKLKLSQAEDFSKKPKKYFLVEFPYPSGDGLHVGHVLSYTAVDIMVRKKRMEGYNVLFPIGWDAFGLPTENYAIKEGLHPEEVTKKNIKIFKKQLQSLGISFDWSREINTSDPNYYHWTQWIFLQLFKHKLAYQAKIPINWCPKCKIGLANEEVINGKCERCGTPVVRRVIKQWMLKITAYADKLIDGLKDVDYLDEIKTQQINWIGRSEGTNIKFNLKGQNNNIKDYLEVFTTRVDTIFGITAMVIAPEHPLIQKIKSQILNYSEVEKYISQASRKSDLERTNLVKEKTGVELKGIKAINPVNNKEIPIWIADYVIASYGGGAVMMVPAHDQRDFDFAKKYGLPIIEVIKNPKTKQKIENKLLSAYGEDGILVNSGKFNGLSSKEARKKITQWLSQKNIGGKKVNYKLRDWVFSRQHYWGEPIPIIHCPKCGAVPVPEKDLPLKLPYVKKYKPTDTGESPLSKCKDWVNVKCPRCGGPAKRETDTMPNWAGSSWYYIRYTDPNNKKELASQSKMKYWLPVDSYIGGTEHITLHLLYSRFWHKFLYDIKVVPYSEPYKARRSHGTILGEDGRKMSKSFGNVINPDDIIKKYGADTLRVYEMFMGPFDQVIFWNTKAIEGTERFLSRVGKNISRVVSTDIKNNELERIKNKTIKKVSADIEKMRFNTAVSSLMIFLNKMEKQKQIPIVYYDTFLKLLSPFAPHLSEELWHKIHLNISQEKSIFQEKWPQYNPLLVEKEEIDLIIQVNGRVRDKIRAKRNINKDEAEKIALKSEKIKKYIQNKKIKKIIFVPGKLINLVV